MYVFYRLFGASAEAETVFGETEIAEIPEVAEVASAGRGRRGGDATFLHEREVPLATTLEVLELACRAVA